MAELTISSEEISKALHKHVEGFEPGVSREEVGRVTETGDGIARVEGLPSTLSLAKAGTGRQPCARAEAGREALIVPLNCGNSKVSS